ncbi:rhodanese-like domain-containing protein [Streptomyces sp. NPDC101225]|uniref:rhodanese-like domain-containing protein n=1 Tax=Streptomyces sp. NPDC101225 TaxID=3366135 RepID=UPI0038153468
MTTSSTPSALGTGQARPRLHELTITDVRTPGEYASGHLPGAVNLPLDQVNGGLPEIRQAAERGDLLVGCASGARSENARKLLAERGVTVASLTGGTGARAAAGHELDRPAVCATRATWGLCRVWNDQGFSHWPTRTLHDAGDDSGSGPFQRGLARGRLDRLFTSPHAARAFAELMTGIDPA